MGISIYFVDFVSLIVSKILKLSYMMYFLI